jgi:hypothetical protein
MKKMLVLAIAMVAFVGQAHAIELRGERPEDIKARIAKDTAEKAGKAGKVSPEVARVSQAVESSKLADGLTGNQPHELQVALHDELLRKTASEIVASSAKNPKLAKERLEGIANLGKLSAAVRNLDADLGLPEQQKEQAYAALVLAAGKQAAGWPEVTQKNMVQFLEIANESIRSGKSVGEAMDIAKSELKRLAKVDIKLEDIKKLCKLG